MSPDAEASGEYLDAAGQLRIDQRARLGIGAEAELIADGERLLGVAFSPDLRSFLHDFNGGWIGDRPYAGLRSDAPRLDLVARTLEARDRLFLAREFIVLSDDGGDHLIAVRSDPLDRLNGQVDSIDEADGSVRSFATNLGELLLLDLDQAG